MPASNYFRNAFIDFAYRGQAFTPPATRYYALLVSSRGPATSNTAYALNDTVSALATDGVVHLYKCTTAGTSGGGAWASSGQVGEVVTDGTAVFTEQTLAVQTGTFAEASYTGYARVAVTASLANYAGTQSAGSTSASSGTSGTTSNNNAIVFGAPTSGPSYVWAEAQFDASSGGNMLEFAPLSTPKTINNGDAAPSIAAGASVSIFG